MHLAYDIQTKIAISTFVTYTDITHIAHKRSRTQISINKNKTKNKNHMIHVENKLVRLKCVQSHSMAIMKFIHFIKMLFIRMATAV